MKSTIGVGVGVLILRENKVLLGKRHADALKAASALHGEGTWTMPGGKIRFGERFEEAAAREVKEETGMMLKESKVLCVHTDISKDAHFVTIGIIATCEGEPSVQEEAITEWKWFDIDALPSPLFSPSEKILAAYRNCTCSELPYHHPCVRWNSLLHRTLCIHANTK